MPVPGFCPIRSSLGPADAVMGNECGMHHHVFLTSVIFLFRLNFVRLCLNSSYWSFVYLCWFFVVEC